MDASDNARAAQQKSTLLRLAFTPSPFMHRESQLGSIWQIFDTLFGSALGVEDSLCG